jgi:hypothetical protein
VASVSRPAPLGRPQLRALGNSGARRDALLGHTTRSIFDRYNIVSSVICSTPRESWTSLRLSPLLVTIGQNEATWGKTPVLH